MRALPLSRCLHPSPPVVCTTLSVCTTQAVPHRSCPGIALFCTEEGDTFHHALQRGGSSSRLLNGPWVGSSFSQSLEQRKLWLITSRTLTTDSHYKGIAPVSHEVLQSHLETEPASRYVSHPTPMGQGISQASSEGHSDLFYS